MGIIIKQSNPKTGGRVVRVVSTWTNPDDFQEQVRRKNLELSFFSIENRDSKVSTAKNANVDDLIARSASL